MNKSDLILKGLSVGAVALLGACFGRWAFLLTTDTPAKYIHEAIGIEATWVAPFAAAPSALLAIAFLARERSHSYRQLQRLSRRAKYLPVETQAAVITTLELLKEQEEEL